MNRRKKKKKRKTKLLLSIEDTRPGWTRRTEECPKEVSMSLLPYAFSCMARWSISCCLCVECVCSYQQSLAVTLTEGLLLLHLESKASLPQPKNHPLPFRESCWSSQCSPSALKETLPVTNLFWVDPAAKKRTSSIDIEPNWADPCRRLTCIKLAFLRICWVLLGFFRIPEHWPVWNNCHRVTVSFYWMQMK